MTDGRPREKPYRVMVVDDSAVVRNAFRQLVENCSNAKLVDLAVDGQHALRIIARAAMGEEPVELVLLDIEMPVMDGLTALPRILAVDPAPKVLMSSALTSKGASITMQALELGACDYLCKPTSRDGFFNGGFAAELESKISCWGRVVRRGSSLPVPTSTGASRPVPRMSPTEVSGAPRPVFARVGASSPGARREMMDERAVGEAREARVDEARRHPIRAATGMANRVSGPGALAVGSSTGGPQAVLALMSDGGLGRDVPIFLTQHMPATFTAILAEQIARASGRECHEGVHGEVVSAGTIYVAPGGRHMEVVRERDGRVVISLTDEPPENYCKPAVDPMLRSLARAYGAGLCAIILTGMGQDGMIGCRHVREAGGRVIVQDPDSSVVWGMPGAVAKDGLADAVVPVGEMPRLVREFLEHSKKEKIHAL